MSSASEIRAELQKIRTVNKGVLRAQDVVEFALANKQSALYSSPKFNWNVKEAAYAHWLDQARDIIRVYTITVIPSDATPKSVSVTVEPVPEFTSLSSQRGFRKPNAYKLTTEILADKKDRAQLLADTIARLVSIKEVALFTELTSVAQAIARADAAYGKKVAA